MRIEKASSRNLYLRAHLYVNFYWRNSSNSDLNTHSSLPQTQRTSIKHQHNICSWWRPNPVYSVHDIQFSYFIEKLLWKNNKNKNIRKKNIMCLWQKNARAKNRTADPVDLEPLIHIFRNRAEWNSQEIISLISICFFFFFF